MKYATMMTKLKNLSTARPIYAESNFDGVVSVSFFHRSFFCGD